MTLLIGHDDAWASWRSAMQGQRMHHAWLLAGGRGLGKAGFALAAAAELVAEDGVPQPEALAHPDIMLLERPPATSDDEKKREEGKPFNRKRNISVDQIRAMQRRLTTRPTLGARRAIIIDSADDLEKSAVNALLKSLEEPPAGCFFLLVAHRPGGLLPTVRSRCRQLRFHALSDERLAQVLAEQEPDAPAELRQAAIDAAQGSPGAALAFIEDELAPIARELRAIMRQGDPDFTRRGALAAAIGARPDRERLLASVRLAREICAEQARHAPRAHQMRLIDTHDRLVRLGAEIPYANFDPGLTVVEIGGLLAGAAAPKG
jgi:DNA polymerase III subunit delta'